MTPTPSFKIYADIDGYLDDPVLGPVNEMLYETILDVSEPNIASNRHYPIEQSPLEIFKETYSLMNEFVKERHPEEKFIRNHFAKIRGHLLDTYAAEIVLSATFVILSLMKAKKSSRLILAIKRTIDTSSGYFHAFAQLSSNLLKNGISYDFDSTPPPFDWHSKYLDLQERYMALSALYQSTIESPPITDGNNQTLLPFDDPSAAFDVAHLGIVQVKDLLNAAMETNSSDLFQVLRVHLASTNGDLLELVKVSQESFQKRTDSLFYSNLTPSKSFSKIDCIRVFRALYDAGKIATRDGSSLTLKAYFQTIGDLLDIDLSDASTLFSASLADSNSASKHTAIFDQLAKAIQDQFDSR